MSDAITKNQAHMLINTKCLNFIKKHRAIPSIIRVSQDVLDAICSKEQQEEAGAYDGFQYDMAIMYVDDTFEEKSCEVGWIQ